MTSSDYTVATAAQLVGARTPRRREKADDLFTAKTNATDPTNKDQPYIACMPTHDDDDDQGRRANQPHQGGERGGEEGTNNKKSNATSLVIDKTPGPTIHVTQTPPSTTGTSPPPSAPVRILQSKAEQSISARYHVHQPRHTDKIDTSGDNHGPVRNANNGIPPATPTDQLLSDIYFSPIDVNKSQISLSDPLDVAVVPEADLLTPTQERYIDSQRKLAPKHYNRRPSPTTDPWRVKFTLQPEHVDRLVKSLAESPLLQVHVRKQWWDDIADDGSVASSTSEGTPSLSSGSGSASSSFQGSGTLYSQMNVPFLTEQRSPSVVQAILEEEFARDYPDHPNAKKPSPPPVAGIKFGGIALTDPKVHGSPIRYISKDYRLGSKVLQVGACSFLDVPYGTSVRSSLRVLRPSSLSEQCSVLLQVVNQVLDRKTGMKTFLLVAEVDVTESFTRAALTELASHSDTPLHDISVLPPNDPASSEHQRDSSQIDWCALADELELSCAITDAVESVALSFPALSAEHCTMQTLTLLSELERIKTQHQDFLVFRPTGYHDNGMVPSGINHPWISQHLDQKLYDADSHRSRTEHRSLARRLRERVLEAVVERFASGVPFDARIVFEGQVRMIQAVPVLESASNGREGLMRPAAWVCFLSGEYGYLSV